MNLFYLRGVSSNCSIIVQFTANFDAFSAFPLFSKPKWQESFDSPTSTNEKIKLFSISWQTSRHSSLAFVWLYHHVPSATRQLKIEFSLEHRESLVAQHVDMLAIWFWAFIERDANKYSQRLYVVELSLPLKLEEMLCKQHAQKTEKTTDDFSSGIRFTSFPAWGQRKEKNIKMMTNENKNCANTRGKTFPPKI